MEADSSEDSLNYNLNEIKSLGSLKDDRRPLQIVSVNSEKKEFELDVEALSSILLHPDVKDKPVAIVSIAGDFRKGKSFLLNFFLRYLKNFGSSDWLEDQDEPLKGIYLNLLYSKVLLCSIIS
jgi:atlastin 3